MIPRAVLLRKPHMEGLRDQFSAVLDVMPDTEVRAIEAFMGFCAESGVGDPTKADIDAFAELDDQTPYLMLDLADALHRLGLPVQMCEFSRLAAKARRHRLFFKGITKGVNRAYKRQVSVPVEALPAEWQATLKRLRLEEKFAPSILERMTRRLGFFAWSAEGAGLPLDLSDTTSLKALYDDMRARSVAKQRRSDEKEGRIRIDYTPRWSYLRSTWEELRRFAKAHGLSQDVYDQLTITYIELADLESQQEASKIAKSRAACSRLELFSKAEKMLDDARVKNHPHQRHALRNRAAAIALGCAVPARPEDVFTHHILGQGITFEPGRNAYRFRYTAQKTRFSTGQTINIPLRPAWNKFIDALILQDQHPRYLGQLRAKAIDNGRPLYVHYDGTPAVYAWYSRMWTLVTGTGGQIARTLIYDDAIAHGEDGIQAARIATGHAPNSPIVAAYRSEAAQRGHIARGQEIMAGLAGDFDDEEGEDISDL